MSPRAARTLAQAKVNFDYSVVRAPFRGWRATV